jgi:hypothetical protein
VFSANHQCLDAFTVIAHIFSPCINLGLKLYTAVIHMGEGGRGQVLATEKCKYNINIAVAGRDMAYQRAILNIV